MLKSALNNRDYYTVRILSFALVLTLIACSSINFPSHRPNSDLGKVASRDVTNDVNYSSSDKPESVSNAYPSWVLKFYKNSVVSCAEVKAGNLAQAKSVALAKAQANISYQRKSDIQSSIDIKKEISNQSGEQLNNYTITHNTKQLTAGSVSGYEVKRSELLLVSDREEFCILYGSI